MEPYLWSSLATRPREKPARRGEEDSVSGIQLRPTDLTAKHRKLVAQHHDSRSLNSAERNRNRAS
jgi:hypothetical protein